MFSPRTTIITRVVTDVILIALLHCSYFIIEAFGYKRQGFDCGDLTIRFPYKEEIVSNLGVALYGYLLPIIMILLIELCYALYNRFGLVQDRVWIKMGVFMYNFVAVYLVAAGFTFLLTSVIKFTLGRLRPHFWEACMPKEYASPAACNITVSSYTCTNPNEKVVRNTFLSHVSGHASASFVGAFFTVLYLQERLRLKYAPFIRPLLQAICLTTAFYITLTRFTDFYHHSTDLIGGAILGSACSLFIFMRYCKRMNDIQL